jgi:hypothetical protein
MRALAAALALVLAMPLAAQGPAAWRNVDAATGQIIEVAALERLASDFPDSTSVRLRLFSAQLSAGKAEAALASLAWLRERGHVFSQRAQAQIPELIGAAHAEATRALLLPVAEVIAASTVFDEIQAEAGLIESVLVADNGMEAMATSVSRRSVFVRSGSQDWAAYKIADAQALSGIASAADSSRGWIASANIDGSPAKTAGFTGLFELTGDFAKLRRIAAPSGVKVSDIAAGPHGTVYASDPEGGGIYRAPAGATELSVLVAPGTLRSPQGLAVSADGRRLYVSDYRYGVAMIDLSSGAATRLASDVAVALDGIDGLWRHGEELIAVQNGTSPMRIIALRLSGDGLRIVGHRTLEQAHPDWTEPLGGSVAAGSLYYVGNGQWERFDRGVLKRDLRPQPTQIRRLPLAP